ncbi:uncharacterized protein PG998_005131 [Apiospora kogelbergensis]|uniref:uncharacterized protein n=1 Tax=Apiospora kogelbergensis TaxID=1337665 RepID=UPI003130F458
MKNIVLILILTVFGVGPSFAAPRRYPGKFPQDHHAGELSPPRTGNWPATKAAPTHEQLYRSEYDAQQLVAGFRRRSPVVHSVQCGVFGPE